MNSSSIQFWVTLLGSQWSRLPTSLCYCCHQLLEELSWCKSAHHVACFQVVSVIPSPRYLPDFISQLWRKIERLGDKGTKYSIVPDFLLQILSLVVGRPWLVSGVFPVCSIGPVEVAVILMGTVGILCLHCYSKLQQGFSFVFYTPQATAAETQSKQPYHCHLRDFLLCDWNGTDGWLAVHPTWSMHQL